MNHQRCSVYYHEVGSISEHHFDCQTELTSVRLCAVTWPELLSLQEILPKHGWGCNWVFMPYRSCPNFGSESQAVANIYRVCLTQRPNKSHQLGTEPSNLALGLHLNLKSRSENFLPQHPALHYFSHLLTPRRRWKFIHQRNTSWASLRSPGFYPLFA